MNEEVSNSNSEQVSACTAVILLDLGARIANLLVGAEISGPAVSQYELLAGITMSKLGVGE